MKVGYLGNNPVTFGYEAAQQLRGADAFEGFGTHGAIYDAVREGAVELGVLAVENQLAGIVDETLHAVIQPIMERGELARLARLNQAETHVCIVRELAVPVELYLMNQSGKLEDIAAVTTHPIPMRQAKLQLAGLRQARGFRLETCVSTDAAALAAVENGEVAAICSQVAAGYFGLKMIQRVDDPIPGEAYRNVTRFWVVGEEPAGDLRFDEAEVAASPHKICLLFNLDRDESGGLARSLEVFAAAGINLEIIYPLPRRDRSWEYTFVVEFGVPPGKAARMRETLDRLHDVADYALLGVYPRHQTDETVDPA